MSAANNKFAEIKSNFKPSARPRHLFSVGQLSPRASLFFISIVVELAAAGISGVGFVLSSSPLLITGMFIWIAWLAILFLVAVPKARSLLYSAGTVLRRMALIIFTVLAVLGIAEVVAIISFHQVFTQNQGLGDLGKSLQALEHGFHYNDATALAQQATENFLQGENPYKHPNIVTALLDHDSSYDRVTPLRVGMFADQFPYPDNALLAELWEQAVQNPQQPPVELETRLNYPAGSFLIPAPFLLAGLEDIRIVYVLIVAAGCFYAFWLLPKDRRFFFLAAFAVSLEVWNSIATGETGTLVLPFLLLAWLLGKKHPWQSAVFMGLAIATKQTAWFFLPFYMVYLSGITGIRKMLPIAGLVAVIFMVANLPFMIDDPKLWFDSVTAPMTESMFPLGVGIITLVTGGVLDIRYPAVFTAMEFLAFFVCLIWYLHYGRQYPNTGPILAVIPLFFAWRSLWTYFFYLELIVFALVLADTPPDEPSLQPAGKGFVAPDREQGV